MKKILFLLCCIQTLLFGQSVGQEMQTAPAKYAGELPHGIWSWGYKDSTSGKKIVYDIDFVLSDTTDNNKTIKYNYQRRLYSTTTYTKRMKDTVYDFYTKKNYNGIKCIYYYQEGKLTKQIFYDTKGRIQKPRIRGKGK